MPKYGLNDSISQHNLPNAIFLPTTTRIRIWRPACQGRMIRFDNDKNDTKPVGVQRKIKTWVPLHPTRQDTCFP